ncbi:MAG: hypothetical protein KDK76_02575, partial [Chlamydiia bacterium]|nr:hypothetical protein [Chlamydiia bacterium]
LIAAIKALTLYQINQINWVQIKRTFIKPLENQAVQFYDSFGRLFSERMSSFLKSSAQEISIEQWVILPADVNLAEGLESLYESMETLFEGSAWKTNHRLFLHQYLVSLKKIPQMLGNLDITQYITRTTGRIYEKGYGWGILSF